MKNSLLVLLLFPLSALSGASRPNGENLLTCETGKWAVSIRYESEEVTKAELAAFTRAATDNENFAVLGAIDAHGTLDVVFAFEARLKNEKPETREKLFHEYLQLVVATAPQHTFLSCYRPSTQESPSVSGNNSRRQF